MDATKNVRVHCNCCGHETKHEILVERETEGDAVVHNFGPVWWTDLYELVECSGCGAVSLRHSRWFSDARETTVDFYPPRVSRPLPRWKNKLPYGISSLLGESYVALHAGSRRLAVMGARAVLDMVFVETVGEKGTFNAKLRALEDKGFVGSKNREYLNAALDVGSAAIHRGHKPKSEEVNKVFDIVENLLQTIFTLDSAAIDLKAGTPPRKKP